MNRDKTRYARLSGLIDVDALAPKRVTVIGAGSMGQPISSQLARHGVAARAPGQLCLIDGDWVSERNLVGTEYRREHLGMEKAQAAASIIREINDEVNVVFQDLMVTHESIPEIITMASQSDLLGLFADSFDVMLEIAEACGGICPQVMAVFGPNADYAEVAFSVPGVTQSIPQTMGRRKREAIGAPSASGCDTAFVASFVAAVCLELLVGPADRGKLVPCYSDAPLFVLGLRPTWLFENDPAIVARSIIRVQVDSLKEVP